MLLSIFDILRIPIQIRDVTAATAWAAKIGAAAAATAKAGVTTATGAAAVAASAIIVASTQVEVNIAASLSTAAGAVAQEAWSVVPLSGNWHSKGVLTLTVAAGGLSKDKAYVFMFELTNPAGALTSPIVNVMTTLVDGGVTVGSITHVAMMAPNSALYGVSKGANPLQVVVPIFETKSIQQSTPVSGMANTLTVTLNSNYALAAGSTVTMWGLVGSTTMDDYSLSVTSTDTALGDTGDWTQSTGMLVLTIAAGGTNVTTSCEVTFSLDNPVYTQASSTVYVEAMIQDNGVIASAAMTSPADALYGVASGLKPLEVLVPSFGVKSIEQSTPVSGATNTLTVTLTANYELKAGSTVTILGLTGSQTADNGALTVASTSGLLGTAGAWTQGPGQLVLTAASIGTTTGTACVVTFLLTNKASDQTSPPLTVAGTIQDQSGRSIGTIAEAGMSKPGTALYEVSNGADALTVLVPLFTTKSIQQSTLISGVANTFTVTLTANLAIKSGSTVTISGLTGSQTADDMTLAVTSNPNVMAEDSGGWTRAGGLAGALVLTLDAIMAVSTDYVVTFSLLNPTTGQNSATVNVVAAIQDGGAIASAAMTSPTTAMYGVANGFKPLEVRNPCTQEFVYRQYSAHIREIQRVPDDSCSWEFSAFAYTFSDQWGCRYMANNKYLCAKQAPTKTLA